MTVLPLPQTDLDDVLERTRPVWGELHHGRLLITGGTGFFGAWLVESLLWAIDRLELDLTAVLVTRDAAAFSTRAPHVSEHPAIAVWDGDVRTLPAKIGSFDAVIHAATSASATLNADDPLEMLGVNIDGTRHILEIARRSGRIPVLLTSSGAVYGPQPPDVGHLTEDWGGGPDPLVPSSAYGEGKRVAELFASALTAARALDAKVARCFAFVGPGLPLDRHFAIGNFIRDGLAGRPIVVRGDGTTVRSYLYAADLAVWLWTILVRGRTGSAYNVGSEEATDIATLARCVANSFDPPPRVDIADTRPRSAPVDRYVPSTARARTELGLTQDISLEDGIRRTIEWNRTGARDRP